MLTSLMAQYGLPQPNTHRPPQLYIGTGAAADKATASTPAFACASVDTRTAQKHAHQMRTASLVSSLSCYCRAFHEGIAADHMQARTCM
jgi:hypothetical protein